MLKRVLIVTGFLSVLLASAAMAQATFGSLSGVVHDGSDAVLAGASVTLTNPATGTTQAAITDDRGAFTFSQLPVGTYRVTVTLAGFKTQDYNQVVVNVGQEYRLTVTMTVGGVQETVEVVAGVSLVTTSTPEVATVVQQQQILDIPLADRNVTNLIKLQAEIGRAHV